MISLRYQDTIKTPVSDEFANLATQLRSFLLVAHNEDGTLSAAAIAYLASSSGIAPSNTVLALDGSAGAGASLQYSRGDHKHADVNRPSTAEKTTLTRLTAAPVTLVDGATPALDASLGTLFRLSANGNRTIGIPSNPTNGWHILIQHYAAGGSNRTLALNTGAGGFRFNTTYAALSATTSATTDYIEAVYNGTDSKWDIINYVKG